MELRQLKYFIASAETLNFTVAANECCITQSTLSQQIKQLENDLGTPLFERIGKRVFLSEAGKNFLPFARQTVADAEYGVQRIKDIEGLTAGNLRIGFTLSRRAVGWLFSLTVSSTVRRGFSPFLSVKLPFPCLSCGSIRRECTFVMP